MSVFFKILRCILCCSEERDSDTLGRDPLLGRSCYNSYVSNSSRNNNNNHDPLRSHDPNRIHYYPNVSISSPTIKNPGANEVSQSLKSTRPLPPSSSYYTCPSSPKSTQSLPKLKPSPSNTSLSSSTQHSSFSDSQKYSSKSSFSPPKTPCSSTRSSSKPLLSSGGPVPSSFSTPSSSIPKPAIPKDIEFMIKKDIVPEVLEKPSPLSQKAPSSSKPTLAPLPPKLPNQPEKACYTWVHKGTSSIYKIPKDIEDLIKEDIVPDVLKKPLSPSTYKDCFAALLYAEDFYLEKWSDFQLLDVTLKLHEAAIYDKSLKNKHLKKSDKKDDKLLVVFEIDSVPERRPYLLSRDFVFAQRSGGKSKKFQGLLYRVVKSTTVLVEFEKAFYPQHRPNHKYDISFSFNRVCLKRAHQAIAAASDPLFRNYLFPDCAARKRIPSSSPQLYNNYKHNSDINSAVRRILSFEGQPPYLIEGPLCVSKATKFIYNESVTLSKTGIVVQEAVVQICQCLPNSRILICSPLNKTCDVLMENLLEDIPESDMFRANAAFREVDEVPYDILQASLLEGECFSCPSLQELRQYRVIFSTFVSSFRLHNEGITAGHFSHIFLVDASSAIEPETMIALSNFANESTTVIVTGAPHNCSGWVRSDIARKKGLKISYFERLCQTKTYRSCDPMFFTRLREETDSFQSFSSIHLPD